MTERIVFDFLVEHYVANDTLFYGEAKEAVLSGYLGADSDQSLKAQLFQIEELCSLESLTKMEKQNFTYNSPRPSPYGLYQVFCRGLRSKLTERVIEEGININNYDAMLEAWEKALVDAADTEDVFFFSQDRGLDRLNKVYNLLIHENEVEAPALIGIFNNLIIKRELAYLTETYKKVKSEENNND